MLLENVVFMYVKVQQPDFKYQSNTEKEYSVQCIVSKAQAKEWNRTYKKQLAKVIENEDFETTFKIEIPEQFANQDEQFSITLKRSTHYKDGNPLSEASRPRVFLTDTDGELVDITKDKLVGNGSIGAASYEEMSNDFGTFAGLRAIRVDQLIEYKNNNDFSELGKIKSLASDFSGIPDRAPREKAEDTPVTSKDVPKAKEEKKDDPVKVPAKRGPKPKTPVVEVAPEVDPDDDSSPF